MKSIHFIILALVGIWTIQSCKPYEAEDIELGMPPTASFSYSFVDGDPNRVVVTDNSGDVFLRNWTFGNGGVSSEMSDTAYYPFAGTYDITLSVATRGGSNSKTETITIDQTDPAACTDENLVNLVGGCEPGSQKGWTFSFAPGAIAVGPTPGSGEWFSSGPGSLVADQYDDTFIFKLDDNKFEYDNNGLTVHPEHGYEALPFEYDTETANWGFAQGPGGVTQIVLPVGLFMGVKDSGPIYTIIEITETTMTLQSPTLDGAGYFTLLFQAR